MRTTEQQESIEERPLSGAQTPAGESWNIMGMDGSKNYISSEFHDKKTVKILLAEPNAGWIHFMAHDNRLDFYMHLARTEAKTNHKFFTGNTGRLMIQYARELICEEAVNSNMDYILWVDDDMLVPKDVFDGLMRTIVEEKAHIVGALAFTRRWPYEPVIYQFRDKKVEGGKLSLYSDSMVDYPRDSVVECDAVGFGVILMRVDILKKIPKPWFFINQPVGEDILFCIKAKENIEGLKILVDTKVKVGHLSEPEVIGETRFMQTRETEQYKKFKKGKPDEMRKA